ncbi:hypothetical protein SAMN05444422_101665 [Halobiforma haloterrestris]|uniref:Uncharacterized protein n=1 Tax=Natronobacterium haloterrestre TaxID=148448 RepID=A0A1I1DHQ5_NATHA|nr:hypothetical protein [Halobiforma haloterrestris]SFB74475.1 hypothetical protein SAMN05444422_101665 [Halobiforma haloterrestris]
MSDHKFSGTRRSILQSIAGLSVLSIGATGTGTAAIDPSELNRDTVQFVEVTEEYDVPADVPRAARNGTAGYAVDRERNIVTLTNASMASFTPDTVATTADGSYYATDTRISVTGRNRGLPVDTNYRDLGATHAIFDEKQPERPVQVQADGDRIRVASDDLDFDVPVGTEAAETETVGSLERTVRVRNHGTMTVFGHDDYLIFPVGSNDFYARARVDSIRALAQEHVSDIEDVDLITVPKSLAVTKGGGE